MRASPCQSLTSSVLLLLVLVNIPITPHLIASAEQAQKSPAPPPPVGSAAPERFFKLFLPFRTEAASLSPDGRFIAYSIREGENLYVVTQAVDAPSNVLAKVLIGTDNTSTRFVEQGAQEKSPARVLWMGWATSDRLIIETNANLATLLQPRPSSLSPSTGGNSTDPESVWVNVPGAIFAIDADGGNPRTLVSPRDVAEASRKSFFQSNSAFSKLTTPDVEPVDEAEDDEENNENSNRYESGPGNSRSDAPPDGISRSAGAGTTLDGQNERLLEFVRASVHFQGVPIPRSPTFFDYSPKEPGRIVIRTSDLKDYGLYTVDIKSGKLRHAGRESTDEEVTPLLNRQGLIGAGIANTLRTKFPHPFLIHNTGFSLGRWTEIRKVAKVPAVDFTVSPENYLGERSFPLGFDENPEILYYASNVGRNTYAIHGLNVKTGAAAGQSLESPHVDLVDVTSDGFPKPSPLVFDRHSRQFVGVRYQSGIQTALWLRPELRDAQAMLEARFPGRSIDLMEWDKTANRFLAVVRGPTDPGGFYLLDRSPLKIVELARRSSLETSAPQPITRYFSFENPAGGQLTGLIVIPPAVRQKPIPIVVICADEPWRRAPAEFDGEIDALAQMGFAVLQVNPRGTVGFGVKHREAAQGSFDKIQTSDILASIDHLSRAMPLNPKRVAIMGRDRGGHLALRAAQLHPGRFRAVVAINPTIDLANWLADSRWTTALSGSVLAQRFFGGDILRENALMNKSAPITCPLSVWAYRGDAGGNALETFRDALSFFRVSEKSGFPSKFGILSTGFMRDLPEARSDVMRQIEDFLNEHVYAYNVKVGEGLPIDDHTPGPPTRQSGP